MGVHVRWVCRTMGRKSQVDSFREVGALHGVLDSVCLIKSLTSCSHCDSIACAELDQL
jgi:hypothetical protein